jgi:DTW domain-containing protein YfiP
MDLATFLQRRAEQEAQAFVYRKICHNCRQPDFSCYCQWLQAFDPQIRFVILIHPIEVHRRIATGRMSHLSLKNSHLITGHDFTENNEVNEILHSEDNHCLMLYPGRQARNLSPMSVTERFDLVPSHKKLTLFVVDGTWNTARKTMHLSENLKGLPRICFTPASPSNFRVRKQPAQECYSTIEAIHHTIELLGPSCGFSVAQREHDRLLFIFDKMVSRQLDLAHSMECKRR